MTPVVKGRNHNLSVKSLRQFVGLDNPRDRTQNSGRAQEKRAGCRPGLSYSPSPTAGRSTWANEDSRKRSFLNALPPRSDVGLREIRCEGIRERRRRRRPRQTKHKGRLPPSEREGLTPTTTFRFPLAIMNVSRVQSRASSASDERDQVVLFGAFAHMRVFRVAVLPRRTEN